MANRKCSICNGTFPDTEMIKNQKKKWVCANCAKKEVEDTQDRISLANYLENLAGEYKCDSGPLICDASVLMSNKYKYRPGDIEYVIKYALKYNPKMRFDCRNLIYLVCKNYNTAIQFRNNLQAAKSFKITQEIVDSITKTEEVHVSFDAVKELRERQKQDVRERFYGKHIDIDSLPDEEEFEIDLMEDVPMPRKNKDDNNNNDKETESVNEYDYHIDINSIPDWEEEE